jgi:bacillithiol system protein YtxJ
MKFLNRFFISEKEQHELAINWNDLLDELELNKVLKKSKSNAQIIFKHSSKCGISSSVLRRFNKMILNNNLDQKQLYFLKVIENRSLSNRVSALFEIQHESPQLLIIKNKKVVFHRSHYNILDDDFLKYI